MIEINSYLTKKPLVLFYQDVVECARELFGDPQFEGHMDYGPKSSWTNSTKSERVFTSLMASGNWWARMQVCALSCDHTH
jgi:hypothetical protein